jgi:flagellar hook-associated protein 3 FlgL
MFTNLDPNSALFLTDINRIQQRISAANSQVTSGKKIMVASDAPDEIGALLQLRADRQRNTQMQSNLALAQTDASAADETLSSSIKLMDSALTLAVQGSNGTIDASGRQGLAQQIAAIQQRMVANSQTSVQGRFIFSGDQDGSPSYTWDPAAVNPVVSAGGSQSTRLIENPAGGTFSASQTAQQIFDDQDAGGNPTANNVFNALSKLQTALQNNDATGITDSIALIKTASAYLNSKQSFYGYVQGRIQDATDFAGKYDVQLQTEISQKEDADIPSAALAVTQGNTQLQAAFQMRAQMPHSSLFQYLG